MSVLQCYPCLKICQPPPFDKVTIHLLHDNTMTDDNRDKFNYIAGQYNQTVKFYNIEELCKDSIEKLNKYYSTTFKTRGYWTGMWLRLFIPEVLPKEIKKAIYLDSDTVITMDIANYWKIDLEDKVLGVVTEMQFRCEAKFPLVIASLVKEDKYFNSGSLLINIEKFRAASETIEKGLIFLKDKPEFRKYQDQDFLNYCFSEDTLILPPKFNFSILDFRYRPGYDVGDKIVHYLAGTLTMWGGDMWNRLYIEYFLKTPWCNVKTFGNLYLYAVSLYNEQKNLMLRVANLLSGKERILCVTANNADIAKKAFELKDSETILTVSFDDTKSMFEIFMSMKATQGKCVYVFVADKYKDIRDYLVDKGFKEWQDFIDGKLLLSEQYGAQMRPTVLLHPGPMIRAM